MQMKTTVYYFIAIALVNAERWREYGDMVSLEHCWWEVWRLPCPCKCHWFLLFFHKCRGLSKTKHEGLVLLSSSQLPPPRGLPQIYISQQNRQTWNLSTCNISFSAHMLWVLWFNDRFYKSLRLCLFPGLNTSMRTESRHNWSQVDHTEVSLFVSAIATEKLLKTQIDSNFHWQCLGRSMKEDFMG